MHKAATSAAHSKAHFASRLFTYNC